MKPHKNVLMLQEVASGLRDLRTSVVFVGGATTALYINDNAAPSPTPSDDVDFVVEIGSLLELESLEKKLSQLGFKTPVDENLPICRKTFNGITVDIMPTDPEILGFSNPWYPEALAEKIESNLPDQTKIYIFSLPYFLATKLAAYESRGKKDPRWSQDLEDIVTVLDGNTDVSALIKSGSQKVTDYLKNELRELIADEPMFEEIAEGFLPYGVERTGRVKRLLQMLKDFVG